MNKLFSLLVLTIVCSSIAGQLQHNGKQSVCQNGRLHEMTYDLSQDDVQIFHVEELTSLKQIQCSTDGSSLRIEFFDLTSTMNYLSLFQQKNNILTGLSNKYCSEIPQKKGQVIKEIVDVEIDGKALLLRTMKTSFSRVFNSGSVAYKSTKDTCGDALGLGDTWDKDVCLGMNTDSCEKAKADIPIYSNEYLTLDCANCYVGLEAEVFFNMELSITKLITISGGFKNAKINAGLDLNAVATKAWSTSIDKHLELDPNIPIAAFAIAGIPITLYADIPLEIKADVTVNTVATVQAGVDIVYDIGDNYISWSPADSWQHHASTPKTTFTPHAAGQDTTNVVADISLIPTINLHVDDIFFVGTNLDPSLKINVVGKTETMQICESTDYDINQTVDAGMDIDIKFVHEHRTFGPYQAWDINGEINQNCWTVGQTY